MQVLSDAEGSSQGAYHEEREALVASGDRTHSLRRWLAPAAVIAGLLGVVAVFRVPTGQTQPADVDVRGETELDQIFPAGKKPCEVPKDFCQDKRKNSLSYKDCDNDGIMDPYCEGSELLRFGFISSKDGCKNNWPNGFCKRKPPSDKEGGQFNPNKAAPNEVTIIHFNDVYQVAGVLQDGVRRGGMSRAAHFINMERVRNPDRTFVVFAGDLLSPSTLSDMFKGAHMIDVLNMLKLDAASLGNHEFDFGVDVLTKRMGESKFPWLNTNLMNETGGLLPGTRPRLSRTIPFTPPFSSESKESKVCIFGSAYDVRKTIFKDKERIKHLDTIESASKEAKHLRESENCDVVLALTHQFSDDDCKFSKALGKDVDLILGGHDHSTELTSVCGHAPYVKADSDLKTQWIMTLWLTEDGKVESVDGRLISLTDADPISEEVHAEVLKWEEKAEKAMGEKMGCSNEPMDAVAAHVRQGETNAGNFFADSMKSFHKTDIAMMNGGAIRGNKVFDKGTLTKKIITAMHPFGNQVAKIWATGKEVRDYVEHALRCFKDVCGDFVQIAGLKYSFDASAEVGQRLKKLQHEDGTEVKDDEKFSLAITDYMLSTSPLKHNELYQMTTLNDAVPLLLALYDPIEQAGEKCISPVKDGRITAL